MRMRKTRAKTVVVAGVALLCALALAEAAEALAVAKAIALGGFHTCALLGDGTLQCWGRNDYGQLGNVSAPATLVTAPTEVGGLTGVAALSAGGYHNCALLSDSSIWCWGRNDKGQLGNGTPVAQSTAPTKVVGIGPAVMVSSGAYHTCALLVDETVWCWGWNEFGQLGNGTLLDSATPTQVLGGISSATVIASGGHHSCAVLADGTMRCWGGNDYGQLGNGTLIPSGSIVGTNVGGAVPVPTQVTGIATAVTASAGFVHTCALLADGTLRCWGWNGYGELGDGTTNEATAPTQVVGIAGATAVTAGGYHTCTTASNGTLWCWGRNDSGQLGNGTTTGALTPTVVPGVAGVMVSAGHMHTCALLSGGTADCWGQNGWGQLGNGTTTDSARPKLVSDSRSTSPSSDTAVATIDATGLAASMSVGSALSGFRLFDIDMGPSRGADRTAKFICWSEVRRTSLPTFMILG